MILHLVRIVFVLAVLAISSGYSTHAEVQTQVADPHAPAPGWWRPSSWWWGLEPQTKATLVIIIPFVLAVGVMLADIAFPRKSLGGISGLFFGLAAGILVAYILGMVVGLGASLFLPSGSEGPTAPARGQAGEQDGSAFGRADLAVRQADVAARNAELVDATAAEAGRQARAAAERAREAAAEAARTGLAADKRAAASAEGAAQAAEKQQQQALRAAADARKAAQAAKASADKALEAVLAPQESEGEAPRGAGLVNTVKLLVGAFAIYLCVSFVLQTKDDFRFIIPYVEFARERRGARPILLDTSVIIDGRIADIADTQILESRLVVPRFVLEEIQEIADSSDKLKRNRGRRGLDMLNRLRSNEKISIQLMDIRVQSVEEAPGVDQKLVALAQHLDARVVTNDYNLNKICKLKSVDVININDLANALKPVVLPGENITVKVIKPGEEMGQGVGYLDDGTMVVAEQGREHIGKEMVLVVTSVLQTSAGRMIFGRPTGPAAAGPPRPRRA